MQKGFIHEKKGDFEYLLSPLLKEAGVLHCFTTRCGGFSGEHLTSLNLGLGRGDKKENLIRNYNVVFDALGFTGKNLSMTKQVHEDMVSPIYEPTLRSEGADAVITDKKNIPLMSYSADCVPVLLYDKEKNVCAAVHSGWRSTVKKITGRTIEKMTSLYGTNPSSVIVAIGPSIEKSCFQVGYEVYEAFSETFSNLSFMEEDGDGVHYHADLWEAIHITLLSSGVREENISLSGECTVCNEDLFFSSRRQKGKFGAMGAFIELR